MKRNFLALCSVVLLLFLVVVGLFYWNQDGGRETTLIGDKVCGNLVSEEAQDNCCLEIHKDDATIQCVGKWQYVNGLGQCQYVCDGALPACTEEAKACVNATSVSRNASNDCEFDACP